MAPETLEKDPTAAGTWIDRQASPFFKALKLSGHCFVNIRMFKPIENFYDDIYWEQDLRYSRE